MLATTLIPSGCTLYDMRIQGTLQLEDTTNSIFYTLRPAFGGVFSRIWASVFRFVVYLHKTLV
jgi:hypothetical protein